MIWQFVWPVAEVPLAVAHSALTQAFQSSGQSCIYIYRFPPGHWFIFIVKRSIPSQKVKPHIVEVVAPTVGDQLVTTSYR